MDPAGDFAGIVDAMQTEGPAIWAALPLDEQSLVIAIFVSICGPCTSLGRRHSLDQPEAVQDA